VGLLCHTGSVPARSLRYQEFLPGLDDWKVAIGKVAVGRAGPKASGVCVTLGVEGAEVMFGSIVLDLEIVGDCFAFRMVAKDHLVGRLFEVEVLHQSSSAVLGGLPELLSTLLDV